MPTNDNQKILWNHTRSMFEAFNRRRFHLFRLDKLKCDWKWPEIIEENTKIYPKRLLLLLSFLSVWKLVLHPPKWLFFKEKMFRFLFSRNKIQSKYSYHYKLCSFLWANTRSDTSKPKSVWNAFQIRCLTWMRWCVDIRWWYHISWRHCIRCCEKLHLVHSYSIHSTILHCLCLRFFSLQLYLIVFCMRMSLSENYFSFACQLRKHVQYALHYTAFCSCTARKGSAETSNTRGREATTRICLKWIPAMLYLRISKIIWHTQQKSSQNWVRVAGKRMF